MAPRILNVVGKKVRELRMGLGMTQHDLAVKCSVLGWDVTGSTIAKIETGLRAVYDAEIVVFGIVLRCSAQEILPKTISAELRSCLHKPARR